MQPWGVNCQDDGYEARVKMDIPRSQQPENKGIQIRMANRA